VIIGETHEDDGTYTIIAAIPDGPGAWMVTAQRKDKQEFRLYRYWRTSDEGTALRRHGEDTSIREIALIEMMLGAGDDF